MDCLITVTPLPYKATVCLPFVNYIFLDRPVFEATSMLSESYHEAGECIDYLKSTLLGSSEPEIGYLTELKTSLSYFKRADYCKLKIWIDENNPKNQEQIEFLKHLRDRVTEIATKKIQKFPQSPRRYYIPDTSQATL